MKKNMMLATLVILLGFATGCSKEKVLECSKKEDSTGMAMEQTIKTKFNKNEIKNIDVTMDVNIEDAYKEYKSSIIKSVENQYSVYKDKTGITYSVDEKDSGLVVTIKADLKKMDDETKEELSMVDAKADFDTAKKELEKEGYTCK